MHLLAAAVEHGVQVDPELGREASHLSLDDVGHRALGSGARVMLRLQLLTGRRWEAVRENMQDFGCIFDRGLKSSYVKPRGRGAL